MSSAPTTERAAPVPAGTDAALGVWQEFTLRAAHAIAGRTDRARSGDYEQDAPLEEALLAGPAAVYLAGRDGTAQALALDLDAKTPDQVAAAWGDVEHARAWLDRYSLESVVCRSSEHGGFHVFVTFAERFDAVLLRRLGAALARELDTIDTTMLRNAATGAIRPPGALHRAGSRSAPIDGDLDAALATLERGNEVAALHELCRDLGVRVGTKLSTQTWRLLTQGDDGKLRRSRSEAFHALALGVKDPGWSEHRLRAELRKHEHDLSTLAVEPHGSAGDQLGYHWQRAQVSDDPIAPSESVATTLRWYRRLIAAWPTERRQMDTDRDLLEHVVNRCELGGRLDCSLSVRDASSTTVYSKTACDDALKRLDGDWHVLRRSLFAKRNRQSTRYELLPIEEWPADLQARVKSSALDVEHPEVRAIATSELWARGTGEQALGKRRLRIYRYAAALGQRVVSTTEFCDEFHVTTARAFEQRNLEPLAELGFLERGGGGLWRAGDRPRGLVRAQARHGAARPAQMRAEREDAAERLTDWLETNPDEPRRLRHRRLRAPRSNLPGDSSAPVEAWQEQLRSTFDAVPALA